MPSNGVIADRKARPVEEDDPMNRRSFSRAAFAAVAISEPEVPNPG
jgi:hypothetical protein